MGVGRAAQKEEMYAFQMLLGHQGDHFSAY
jgi:hypothetical protein